MGICFVVCVCVCWCISCMHDWSPVGTYWVLLVLVVTRTVKVKSHI